MYKQRKLFNGRPANMKKSSGTKSSTVAVWIGLVALVLILWAGIPGKREQETPTSNEEGASKVHSRMTEGVTSGSVGGIPFLRCSNSQSGKSDTNIVMLHGAKFTKEDWRTSGVLEKLCMIPTFSVTALDLDKNAGHTDLKKILDAMTDASQTRLPVALVTPSASGNTIVDWLDNIDELKQYVSAWIPVAAGAVSRASEDQLKGLKGLPILAIYGNNDGMGKTVSNILGEESGAQVTEIPGSHPCYLDSPDPFVEHVQKFLSTGQPK
jgi:pimeloyl-ACP methyl ester carboxylesterase